MTTCKVCREEKPDTEFYAGVGKNCKECYKKRVRENRAANVDHYRKYDRTRYNENPARQELARKTFKAALESGKHTEYSRKWREKNPEKHKAHNALNNAIRDGKIARQGCSVCGEKAQAHHHDYSKPLDVVWFCPKHHSAAHLEVRVYD